SDLVTSSNSRFGQVPGRCTVLPSTNRNTRPTGTPVIWNCPWASDTALRVVSTMIKVAPGTGVSVLSSTTPLTLVLAGSPVSCPEATNTAGAPVFPGNDASTTLLSNPGADPSVRIACARPS